MSQTQTAQPQPSMPPMEPSEESTAAQLQVARKQGEVYHEAVKAMDQESGAQIERAGEFEVGIVVENAEGLWQMDGDELRWQNPTDENAHVEVVVCDAADGRFVPGLEIEVTIETSDGREIGTHPMPFLWHPWLYHYGRNWHLPEEGDYRLRVRIAPPTFHRHDHKNGNRYTQPVEVAFTRHIKPGQKKS